MKVFQFIAVSIVLILAILVASTWPYSGMVILSVFTSPLNNPCGDRSIKEYVRRDCYTKKPVSPITPDNANAKVNIGKNEYCALLYVIVEGQRSDVFRELLENGANPELCDNYPESFYKKLAGYCYRMRSHVAKEFIELFQ